MNPEFRTFFEGNYPEVVRTLAVAMGSRSGAEEAAQEGFALALGRWRRVSTMSRPAAWVYVVALRAGWRALPVSQEMGGAEAAFTSGVEEAVVDRIVVADALAKLTSRQRLAVVLRFRADMTVSEIADAMGCAPGTVKATLHQALAKLKVSLAEDLLSGEVVHGTR